MEKPEFVHAFPHLPRGPGVSLLTDVEIFAWPFLKMRLLDYR